MNEKTETNESEQTESASQFSDRTIDPISTDMSDSANIKQYGSIPTVQAKTKPEKATPENADKLVVDNSYDGRIRPGIVAVSIILLLASAPTISMLIGMIASIAFGGASYTYWLSAGGWFNYVAYALSVVAFVSAVGLLLRYKWSLIAGVISMSAYAIMNTYFLSRVILEAGLQYEMSYASLGIFLLYPIYIVIYVTGTIYLLRPKVRAMFY